MNQDSAGSQRALVHEISDKRPLFHVGSPNPHSAAGKKKRKWARTEPHPHARRCRAHHPHGASRPRATIPATRVRTSPTVRPIYFCIANTGKEPIALDFRDLDAKTFLTKLIAKADVAVENFRPGVMTTTGVLESEGGRPTRVGISVFPTPWPASTATPATIACRPSSPPRAWPAWSGSSANGLHEKNRRETKACMKSVLTTDTVENCQKKIDEAGQRAWRSTPATLSRAADRGPQHDQENGRRPARHGHAGQVTVLGTPTTPKRTLWRTTRTATGSVPSSSNVPGAHPGASAEQGSAGQRRDGRREPFAFAARTVLSFSRLFFYRRKHFHTEKIAEKTIYFCGFRCIKF
ncbi:MAG: CoA transferase [Aeriscardovia sp.]|nr:CoA transferase [Aeriscardovia sp.]